MADTIEHELKVKARPDESFRALGTENGIKGWWAKNSDVDEAAGGKVQLRFTHPDMSAVMSFDITRFESGKALEWTCRDNTNSIWPGSKLIWEIEPSSNGSTVRFRHVGLKEGGNYDEIVAGWQYFMASLQAYLDGGKATPSD